MRKVRRGIISIGVALFLPFFWLMPCQARTIYYLDNSSPNAGDSNAGTSPHAPFATLAAVNNRPFVAGDVIAIKAGTRYKGTLSITADGAAGQPVRFVAYGIGPKPIIEGSETNNIALRGARYIEIDGLASQGALRGSVQIDPASNHNSIRNMEIFNAGFGVEVWGQFNECHGNFVHDLKMIRNTQGSAGTRAGDDDFGAVAFAIFNSNNQFGHNRVERAKASSYDYGSDGGGFETWKTVTHLRIYNNWVQDSNGFFEAGGEPGDRIANIVLDRNVSLNNGGFHFLHNSPGTGNFGITVGAIELRYNTIVEQHPIKFGLSFSGPVSNDYYFHHNIVDLAQASAIFNHPVANRSYNRYHGPPIHRYGLDRLKLGESRGDPMFVSNTDLRLKAGSPADGLGALEPVKLPLN